jgi:hypothetical protein
MLTRNQNTVLCPECGRSWHFMEGLKAGDACPSDDCPSHAQKPIGILLAVCKDFDDQGVQSIGASAALRAMVPYWKGHLAERHNPLILSEDIDELKNRLEIMRAKIMRRLLAVPGASS